jgi:DNA-binding transcriptional MocR family regulator
MSISARTLYHEVLAAYCFGEAVCWPSQRLLASETGVSQPTISRRLRDLEAAGWLTIERRLSPNGWVMNVYTLLQPFAVSRWLAERIVKRARSRRPPMHREAVNTNGVVVAHGGIREALRRYETRHRGPPDRVAGGGPP